MKMTKKHYKYYTFISPEGTVVKEYTTIKKFSKKYNLTKTGFFNIIKGKWKHYKGWKFVSVDNDIADFFRNGDGMRRD